MIAGRLEQRERYAALHPDLKAGLDAVASLKGNADIGEYKINDRVTLIISTYATTLERSNKYEAHRKMIDIQYAITGQERVDWSPLQGMELSDSYEASRDRAFWIAPTQQTSVLIGNGVFAVFFPEDAHRPCLPGAEGEETVLKATVKIEDWCPGSGK